MRPFSPHIGLGEDALTIELAVLAENTVVVDIERARDDICQLAAQSLRIHLLRRDGPTGAVSHPPGPNRTGSGLLSVSSAGSENTQPATNRKPTSLENTRHRNFYI